MVREIEQSELKKIRWILNTYLKSISFALTAIAIILMVMIVISSFS